VAASARRFVIVADFRKQAKTLGSTWKSGVPIEIIPAARRPVEEKLRALGGGTFFTQLVVLLV
jgi:ribose 5-phosphate isomerase A